MSTQGVRGHPMRGPRQRKMVIDLNVSLSETRDQEGTSHPVNIQQVPTNNLPGQCVPPPPPPIPPSAPMIDVDAIDDDVVESSAVAFAEAKSKSRANRGRPVMIDLDSECSSRLLINNRYKRRRIPPNQPVIDCEHVCTNVKEAVPNPQPPPQEPTFTCLICMGPFTQETSTKCGHIFCKVCIKTAIARQGKCPTCRKKVTTRELIRVFLPATR